MATIKSHSDLEQSKKLAKILPLESADMWYHGHCSPWESEREYDSDACPFHSMRPNWDTPCWSLAALLDVLLILDNRSPVISKTFDGKYRVIYHSTAYEKAIITSDYNNPVDACYEMIIKLHEKSLL